MAQQVKLLLPMPASAIRLPVRVLAALLLGQLPANVPGQVAEDGPRTWVLATYWLEFLPSGFSLAQTWLLWRFGK